MQFLFDRQESVPQLRRLVSTGGEEAPESDDALRKRLLDLLIAGRLTAIECRLSGVPSKEAEQPPQDRQPLAARTADAGGKKSDRRAVKTWIEIRLIDDEGNPVPNEKYRLVLPDGSTAEGSLDANGWARRDDIDPGSCQVSFPNIDGPLWRPV